MDYDKYYKTTLDQISDPLDAIDKQWDDQIYR